MAPANLRAVILTALRVEFEAARFFLDNCREDIHPVSQTIYERGDFVENGKVWDVGLVEIGSGNVDAAIETNRALEHFNPQVVFFIGIAGGIKDVKIGDVVASTKIYGYESGKAETEQFRARSEVGQSSYALVQRARAEARNRDWLKRLSSLPNPVPDVYVSPIAAGEKVVASTRSAVCKFLQARYSDAVAVEMEGYGFSRAAYGQQSVLSMVVRGISDLLDNKNDDKTLEPESVRHKKASEYASAFAFQVLSKSDPTVGVTGTHADPRKVAPQVWDDLFSRFQEKDLPTIGALFNERLTPLQRDPHPELSQLDSLQSLRAVLERMDDLEMAVTWIGQIIQFFENPPEGEPARSVSPALRTWYETYKPSEPEPEPEPKSEKKSPGYLLLALTPKDDKDTVAVTAELHTPDGEIDTELLPRDSKCSVDDPYDDLYRYITAAVRKARKIKTIEVFLSWRHLKLPVHEWKVDIGIGEPKSLMKMPRSTLVRSLDRLTQDDWVDEWLETLEAQLTSLKDCCDDVENYCHAVERLDCEALETELLLNDRQYLILKLLSMLPENEEDLEQLLSIVILAGLPIWFWFYTRPSDVKAISEAIDKLLTAQNLQDSAILAEEIRKKRQTLPNLGLLCDCPTRLPVLVDWKNGRLRQPAA